MWRSFFLAVGIFIILVGFETMVVDQVVMTNARRIPKIVSATARNMVTSAAPAGSPSQPMTSGLPNSYQMPTYRPLAGGPATGGQTRYNGTQSATFNRVLDPSSGTASTQPSGLGYAGYQKNGNNPVAPPVASIPAKRPSVRKPRIIQTKDWMPWSLLAAGTIIVLYTQSLGRSDG
jgi:hypothetical protein